MRTFNAASALALATLFVVSACGDDTQEGADRGTPAPIGNLRVSWSLRFTNGMSTTCEELNLSGVRIRVAGLEAAGEIGLDGGSEPDTVVDCNLGERVYSNVTAGRYPVRVTLLRGAAALDEQAMNIDVLENQTAEAQFAFELAPTINNDRGGLRLAWTIDRRPAAATCSEFDGATVELRTEPESIEQVSHDAPCVDGQYQFDSLRAGSYRFRLRLVKASGETIATNFVNAAVIADTVTPASVVNLVPPNLARARLVTLWTVNGSTNTPAACEAISAGMMMLVMSAASGQASPDPIEASCGTGRLGYEDLLDEGLFDIELRLAYDGGLAITSTTFLGVRLTRGQTSTVSADFVIE